jgi:uncharacterized protein (UPF0332 family)
VIDARLRELVTLRMQQAAETLHEARILAGENTGRGAVSRAYYAMFYAVLALLATRGLGSSKHSGTIALFDREFVKVGDFPRTLSRSLHMAFEHRQQADYGELTPPDEMVVAGIIEEAETFVQSVATYMKGNGFLPLE